METGRGDIAAALRSAEERDSEALCTCDWVFIGLSSQGRGFWKTDPCFISSPPQEALWQPRGCASGAGARGPWPPFRHTLLSAAVHAAVWLSPGGPLWPICSAAALAEPQMLFRRTGGPRPRSCASGGTRGSWLVEASAATKLAPGTPASARRFEGQC